MDNILWDGFTDELQKVAGPAAERILEEAARAAAKNRQSMSLMDRLFGRTPPAAARALEEQSAARLAPMSPRAEASRPKPSWERTWQDQGL